MADQSSKAADAHLSGIAALAAAIKPYRKLYEVLERLERDKEEQELNQLLLEIVEYRLQRGVAPYPALLAVMQQAVEVILEIKALEAGQVCGLVRTGDEERG